MKEKTTQTVQTDKECYLSREELEDMLEKQFKQKWGVPKDLSWALTVNWDDCHGEGGGIMGVTIHYKKEETKELENKET